MSIKSQDLLLRGIESWFWKYGNWPTPSQLARHVGYSEAHVWRTVAELEALGIHIRKAGHGGQRVLGFAWLMAGDE